MSGLTWPEVVLFAVAILVLGPIIVPIIAGVGTFLAALAVVAGVEGADAIRKRLTRSKKP